MKCFIFKVIAQMEKNEKSIPKMMDINEADDIWGHKGLGLLKTIAKCYEVKVMGTL
jgi:hypothetical protein